MPHEVIMPQLGMNQDTAVIVSWLKAPGEAVAAGDALFEVETDKATMEIEAETDGFLTDVRVEAGEAAPVGSVVAVIAETADAAAEQPAPSETPAQPAQAPKAPEAPQKPAAPQPVSAPQPIEGRILASPKAKRLARERGIDLAAVVAAGAREPLHAADIPDQAAAPVQPYPAQAAGGCQLSAHAELSAFNDLRAWIAKQAGAEPSTARLWAGFAAGALRAALEAGVEAEICVSTARLDSGVMVKATHRNPDLVGFGDPAEGDGEPSLSLIDLTGSRLNGYRPGGAEASLRLTISGGGERAELTLEFDEASLPLDAAAVMLADLAARAEEPLRHLL